MPGEVCAGRQEGVGRRRRLRHARRWPDSRLGGQGTRIAHVEHVVHGRDAGGVPAGNVRVEILRVIEEPAHVGDGRDTPVGDGAVVRNGQGRVRIELRERRRQGALAREGVGAGLRRRGWGRRRRGRRRRRARAQWQWSGAASRSPARAIGRGEGRGARPRATDGQLVGGGQGVCVLPRVERGGRVRWGARCGPGGGRACG
jgi:hypothetical protein